MLISRRGLTAAGLALAAVGGVGVTSTMTAGAAQIAEPRPATVTPGPTATLVAPPPPLPGAGGKSSAHGVSAAAEGAPPAVEPTQGNAPKGLPGRIAPASGKAGARFSAQVQSLAAPAPPAVPGHSAVYFYAQASQKVVAEGTYATMTIGKPTVGTGAYHSLAEIAVQTEYDNRKVEHAVEVGWTVDPGLFKDDEPHLFVYHWVNGKPSCYNTCGFVPFDPPPEPGPTAGPTTAPGPALTSIRPGAVLPEGEAKVFGIQHFKERWWISYDGKWIGYFPDSLWKGLRFYESEVVQWWGEVAAVSADEPCAEMGTGVAASETGAAEIRRIRLIGGPAVNIAAGTRGDFYSVKQVGKDAIRIGGKGPCPA